MEVFCTVNIYNKGDQAPSTEKAFLGKLSEAVAVYYFEKIKCWKVLQKNLHWGWGEIDLVVEDKSQSHTWIVEVRSRAHNHHLPAHWLGQRKITKLKRLAAVLGVQWNRPIRILLLQVYLKEKRGRHVHGWGYSVNARALLSEFEIRE